MTAGDYAKTLLCRTAVGVHTPDRLFRYTLAHSEERTREARTSYWTKRALQDVPDGPVVGRPGDAGSQDAKCTAAGREGCPTGQRGSVAGYVCLGRERDDARLYLFDRRR